MTWAEEHAVKGWTHGFDMYNHPFLRLDHPEAGAFTITKNIWGQNDFHVSRGIEEREYIGPVFCNGVSEAKRVVEIAIMQHRGADQQLELIGV